MAAVATNGGGGTPLHAPYCFSFMRRGKSAAAKAAEEKEQQQQQGGTTPTSPGGTPSSPTQGPPAAATATPVDPVHPYENSIKPIATVETVEEFWSAYNYLRRPNDLPTTTDYHFFRDGIKPTWEDSNNARGGKWIVRLPKGLASRYWEEVILALIGGQFPGVPDGEICGLVVSIRYSEDILGIWNRTATEREIVERLRDAIKRVLQLPPHAFMEYKPHQTSIQDKSSFRNTQVWKPKSASGGPSGSGVPGGGPGEGGRPEGARETRRSGSWGEREKKWR